MAQYREVQAFAQFASDLDKATQMQLARGQRLTELLKQDIYTPYDVVDQIFSVFAGTGGFLDALEVSDVAAFEKGMLEFIKQKYPEMVEKVRTTKEWTPDIEETARKAMDEFQKQFLASKSADKEPAAV
jgi:F-type H+-transporting ATPase subunit alpha